MDPSRAGETTSSILAHELGGDFPCARCRYNLRGLSIRAVCPECGMPIRATLLARLDPRAGELQPIFFPRLTAAGIVLWPTGAFLAALFAWTQRIAGLLEVSVPSGVAWAVLACAAASGLGALAFVYPHAGPQARRGMPPALLGVVAYVPFLVLMLDLHMRPDRTAPYGGPPPADIARTLTHLLAMACVILIVVCLRPNAQLLAARSLLMRTGRVDRQTLVAVGAVAALASAGSALRLLGHAFTGPAEQLVDQVGQAIVLVGSVLLTVGFFGLAFDAWRLAPVILEPPLTLDQVLASPAQPPKHAESTQ